MKKYNGITLYEGPSAIDGEPIVVVLTLHSSNEKTGDMCQTWILRQDLAPQEAVKVGADESVCGNCKHRHYLGGACYVIPFQAPNNVWSSWKEGKYPAATKRHINRLRGRAIRFGAYGDPAAAPYEIWEKLSEVASMTTGYTHQPHLALQEGLLDHCMVSADSEAEALFYQGMGAKTFRVKTESQPLLEGEVYCPADSNKEVQCIDCGLCSGAYGAKANIAINVHGQRKKRFEEIPVQQIA